MVISAVNSLIFPLIAVMVIQYILALFALFKLFQRKPRKLNALIWNIIIVLLIIIGPLIYLIIERPEKIITKEKPLRDNNNQDYTI